MAKTRFIKIDKKYIKKVRKEGKARLTGGFKCKNKVTLLYDNNKATGVIIRSKSGDSARVFSRRKLYRGKKGGLYYIRNGKKVYVKK